MEEMPKIIITQEMIDAAKELINKVKVNRTQASGIDTLTGVLGEFVFAQYFYGDWKKNRVGKNKGDVNFKDVEIKTSAFPFRDDLNLLVREDYAQKRKPPFYIQIIISVKDTKADEIRVGTEAFICGFATAREVDSAMLKDFGSKHGGKGGYRCHYIPIHSLHNMKKFESDYKE